MHTDYHLTLGNSIQAFQKRSIIVSITCQSTSSTCQSSTSIEEHHDHQLSYYENSHIVDEIPILTGLFDATCYKIYNIFNEKLIKNIKTITRKMLRNYGNETSDILVNITNATLKFSPDNTIERSPACFSKFNHQSPLIEKILTIFVNRFAKELKWTGSNTFSLQIFRYTPQSGQNTIQKWHYDQGSRKTMVMMIENDFEHFNGLGINIAQNGIQGPFNPNTHFEELDVIPKGNQHISTNYPHNGAVIFDGKNGELIHQMSPLLARTFDEPKSCIRTVIQIKDRAWK